MPPQRRGARKIAPVIINTPAFFGPFGETGITPSTQCSSAPLPEVRCYVPTVVESGTPRVGGRWSASIAPGQARALQQGQGAVAHRSPCWPRSPSPSHKRIVGSPPTGWPPTVIQDAKCKWRCAELTAPADGPYLRSQPRLFGRPRFNICLLAERLNLRSVGRAAPKLAAIGKGNGHKNAPELSTLQWIHNDRHFVARF